MVADTSMWNLLLRFGPDALCVMAYSVVEENTLIYRRLPLPGASPAPLRDIEAAVYDNPFLLSEFRRVWCVVESRSHLLVPPECADEATQRQLFAAAFPSQSLQMHTELTDTPNSLMLHGLQPDFAAFVTRTFTGARIQSHLTSLIRYFASRPGHAGRMGMAVNVRPASLDIIVTQGRRLMLANTFDYAHPEDAVYYILAVRHTLGLDPRTDELLICGDRDAREKLAPMLRTYIGRVMPAIFPPQMFRAGKDSMLAPFDLTVTPLCE